MPPATSGRPLVVAIGSFAPDVPADRKAVIDAVLRAGCRPIDALDGADVFVGVFGACPGAEEQREYRRAVARGVPRHIYLAAGAHDAFREQLRAENTCEAFASTAELRALVTQALIELRDSQSDAPTDEPLAGTNVRARRSSTPRRRTCYRGRSSSAGARNSPRSTRGPRRATARWSSRRSAEWARAR